MLRIWNPVWNNLLNFIRSSSLVNFRDFYELKKKKKIINMSPNTISNHNS